MVSLACDQCDWKTKEFKDSADAKRSLTYHMKREHAGKPVQKKKAYKQRKATAVRKASKNCGNNHGLIKDLLLVQVQQMQRLILEIGGE